MESETPFVLLKDVLYHGHCQRYSLAKLDCPYFFFDWKESKSFQSHDRLNSIGRVRLALNVKVGLGPLV